MAVFYTYVYHALHICSDSSNLSNELYYLKSFAISRKYNLSIIEKALNKFKNPKRSVCPSNPSRNRVILPFYSSIFFKTYEILSHFSFKVYFKPVNEINFSPLKDPIPTGNRCDTYFILY